MHGRFVYDKYEEEGRVHNVMEFSYYIDIVYLPREFDVRDDGRRLLGKMALFRSSKNQSPFQFFIKS